jgi:hypothetical protein
MSTCSHGMVTTTPPDLDLGTRGVAGRGGAWRRTMLHPGSSGLTKSISSGIPSAPMNRIAGLLAANDKCKTTNHRNRGSRNRCDAQYRAQFTRWIVVPSFHFLKLKLTWNAAAAEGQARGRGKCEPIAPTELADN